MTGRLNVVEGLIGLLAGMTLCGIGGSIYAFITCRNTLSYRIKRFIKNSGLRTRKVIVEKWEDDKYLIECGAEAIPAEYLRQKYKIAMDEDVTLEYFVEHASKIIEYISDSGEGFFIVRGDTDLLRPPEPPEDYPPLPEGWENCEI